jgi:hypothetical protein
MHVIQIFSKYFYLYIPYIIMFLILIIHIIHNIHKIVYRILDQQLYELLISLIV